ncbi:hypothetical protein B0H14DRAFT_2601991 [Mycena olivaceomarginata]|nr:hypothetical protein B0H14DRAFT_2601991 [Mycena olivaceomarginata]
MARWSQGSRLYGLGLASLSWFGNLQLLFGFWRHRSHGLSGYDLCLGSGGLTSWPGKLRLLFGFWGLDGHRGRGLASCDSLLGSGGLTSWPGKLRLLFEHQGASGSSPGKLRLLFGFWGNRLRFGLASHNFFLASRGCFGPMVAGQPGQLACLCRGFITGNNMPNFWRDGFGGPVETCPPTLCIATDGECTFAVHGLTGAEYSTASMEAEPAVLHHLTNKGDMLGHGRMHTKSFGENEGTSFVIGKFSVMTTKHLDFEAWRGVVWQATALLQPPVPSLSLLLRPSLSHLPVHDAGFNDPLRGLRVKMGRIDSKPLKIGRVSHLAGIEKQIWLGASVNNGRPAPHCDVRLAQTAKRKEKNSFAELGDKINRLSDFCLDADWVESIGEEMTVNREIEAAIFEFGPRNDEASAEAVILAHNLLARESPMILPDLRGSSTSRFDLAAEFDIEKYLHVLADSITAAKETPVDARHHGPTNGKGGTSSKAAADSVATKADEWGSWA